MHPYKYSLLGLLIIFFFSASSSNLSAPTLPVNAYADVGTDLLKSDIPASPTAAALGQYGEVPVSLYTGVQQVSIPLFNLRGNHTSLPVSLSYHPMIKLEQLASTTGLGFSCNTGGVITRQIRDEPDDVYLIKEQLSCYRCNDCFNCTTCGETSTDADCRTCLDQNKICLSRHNTAAQTEVGYLYHPAVVDALYHKNDYDEDDLEFLFGDEYNLVQGIHYDDLLAEDVVVGSLLANTSALCEDIARGYIEQRTQGSQADKVIAATFIYFLNGLNGSNPFPNTPGFIFRQIFSDLVDNDGIEPLALPYFDISIMEDMPQELQDCIELTVLRPVFALKDTEPDVFNFNFNGYSGQFAFDKNGEVQLFSDQDVEIEYTQNNNFDIDAASGFPTQLESIYQGGITQFTITTPDGMQYIFAETEVSSSSNAGQSLTGDVYRDYGDCTPPLARPYQIPTQKVRAAVSSWYLSEIRNHIGQKEFEFTYEPELTMNHNDINQQLTYFKTENQEYDFNLSVSSNVSLVFGKRLSEIQWASGTGFGTTGKLKFYHTYTRPDLYYPSNFDHRFTAATRNKALERIAWLDNGGTTIREVQFYYDEFPETAVTPCPNNLPQPVYLEAHRSRLRLARMEERGRHPVGGFTTKPAHIFTYNDAPLPPRHSVKQDFWGYYNSNVTTLIPNIYAYENDDTNNNLMGSIYSIFERNGSNNFQLFLNPFVGSDRNFNETDAQSGLLTSIQYPTGGSVHFEYEGHDFDTDNKLIIPSGKGGGLRIKKVYATNGDGKQHYVKDYTYTKAEGGGFTQSSGRLISLPQYTKSLDNSDPKILTIFSRAQAGLETSHGNHVIYEKVTVDQGERGKTVSTFDVAVDYATQSFSDDGNVIYERSDGVSSTTINTYPDNFPHPPHPNIDWNQGTLIQQQHFADDGTPVQTIDYEYEIKEVVQIPAIRANSQYEDVSGGVIQQTSIGKYFLLSGDKRLMKQTTTTHYPQGDVIQEVAYEYNNNLDVHRNPTAQITTNSDGKVHRTETDYAFEAGVNCMLQRNMISIPVQTRYFVDGKFQGGQQTDYSLFAGNQCQPFKIKSLLFTGTSTVGTQLDRFTISEYTPDGFRKRFNQRGFPDYIQEWTDGLLTKVAYDPNNANHVQEFAYTDGSRLNNYVKAIDGQETDIIYDGLQRPENVNIRGGNVATDYEYIYGTPNKHITTTTFADGTPTQTTEATMDQLGRLQREMVNNVVKNEVFYDLDGRIERQTYLPANFKTLTYDNSPLNRLIQETYPDGSRVQTRYESEDEYFRTVVVDENGHETTQLTDFLGRTYKRRDALNGETIWLYDDRNNVTDILSPLAAGDISKTALNYKFTYDNRSRRTSERIPGAAISTMTYYDATDLLKELTDGNSNTQFFSYDQLGREQLVSLTGEGLIRQYVYDNVGLTGADIKDINIGKIKSSRVKILDGSGNFITSTYEYDEYGRLENTTANNHLNNATGQELTTQIYNDADWLTQTMRSHQGVTNLDIIQDYKYDRFGRETKLDYNINGSHATLREQTWNDRDQLVQKIIGGGLQSVDYLYNERGWLRHINQPLDLYNDQPDNVPVCNNFEESTTVATDPLPPFQFCDEEEVDLNWLLTVRFQANLTINCYEPCPLMGGPILNENCPTNAAAAEAGLQDAIEEMRRVYAETEIIPCVDGGTETIYRPRLEAGNFPIDLHRIRLCNGTEAYVLENQLSELQADSYTILTTTPLYDARQPITLTNDCGELEQSNLEDLLFRVFSGDTSQDSQFSTEDYILNDGNCEPLQPDCTPEQQAEQLADLQAIIDQNRELEDLTFPTNLRRVILCDGTETYLFEDELTDLSGTYATLQTIKLTNADATVRLGVTFNGTDLGDLFRLSLYYNEDLAGGRAQKNGNISAMAWQTAGRQAMAYGFQYDDLNRLRKADYSDILDNGNLDNTNRYGVDLTYDANGNIKTLSRRGYSTTGNSSCATFIDNLTYTYANNNLSNQLVNVTDVAIDFEKGFNPYSAGAGSNNFAYLYDQNGNLTIDPYKEYVATYNFLNLPESYAFSRTGNTGVIDHLYDVDGVKLQKSVTGDVTKTKDYCKGIEYTGGSLEAVYNSEGRAVPTGGSGFQFEYYLRDHLGNNRVIFSDLDNDGTIEIDPTTGQTEVLASMDYYPFGMEMDGSWDMDITPQNDYLYNGKEVDREYGLKLQHYGVRSYDNVLGRFTGVDPIGQKFAWVSTFNYAENEPIRHIDWYGLQKTDPLTGQTGPFSTEYIQDRILEQAQNTTVTEVTNSNYNPGLVKSLKATGDLIKFTANTFGLIESGGSVLSSLAARSARGIGLAKAAINSADDGVRVLSADELAKVQLDGGGRTFNHFTNTEGISGITGIDKSVLNTLQSGEGITVNTLKFGTGKNSFMAGKEGDIFVTELGATTSRGRLNQIGVFGDKQRFLIQFSEESAFLQGAKVSGQNIERSIYTIPGNSTLEGTFKIIKK